MAQGHSSAADVDLAVGNTENLHVCQRNSRKRLVDLKQVHVSLADASAGKSVRKMLQLFESVPQTLHLFARGKTRRTLLAVPVKVLWRSQLVLVQRQRNP